jgi:hypothetical protein
MTPKEALIEAKQLIERWGWLKGSFARDRYGKSIWIADAKAHIAAGDCGGFCVSGAIAAAVGLSPDFQSSLRLVAFYGTIDATRARFSQAVGVVNQDIAGWNDKPERTLQEVLDALDRAIALSDEVSA